MYIPQKIKFSQKRKKTHIPFKHKRELNFKKTKKIIQIFKPLGWVLIRRVKIPTRPTHWILKKLREPTNPFAIYTIYKLLFLIKRHNKKTEKNTGIFRRGQVKSKKNPNFSQGLWIGFW